MGKLKDLTGQKFGRLTVLYRDMSNFGEGNARWVCQCDCGNTSLPVPGNCLLSGNTSSCGCLGQEARVARAAKLVKDLKGRVFGRMTVLERSESSSNGKTKWLCQCECGNQHAVLAAGLLNGTTKSCGCLHLETVKVNCKTHGMTNTAAYKRWQAMRKRCTNPKAEDYGYYGGRGIVFDTRWESFENFYADMGDPPTDKHTLDRLDSDGNYCKENCKWATRREQGNNTSRNVVIELDGVRHTMQEWCRILPNVLYSTVRSRIQKGWDPVKALTTPKLREGRPCAQAS